MNDSEGTNAGLEDEPIALRARLAELEQADVERKRSEEMLRASEANYRAIFDAANDAIFVHDLETGEILDVNQKMYEMYGYTPEQARQLNVGALSAGKPPYTQADALRWIEKAALGEPQVFEWLAKDKADRLFWVEVNLKRAAIGGEDRLLAVVRDISQRKQTEEALRESEERFRLLAENVPGVIYLCKNDERCTMLYLNDEVEALTGYPKDDFLGGRVSFVDLYHPEDARRIRVEVNRALADQRPFHLVCRLKHRSGEWRWVNEVGVSVSRDDEAILLVGFLNDITDRKRAEEERLRLESQMQHAQKLESLGVLAGGIAHDFNNLLVGILGNASLALMDLPEESPARHTVEQIEQAAQRAAELTNLMLAYSGRGKFVVQPLSLSKVIGEMTHLLEAVVSSKATLKWNLVEDLPAVEADATQVRQVVMNLVTNASEAIGDGRGVIAVTTKVVEADRAYLAGSFFNGKSPEGRYVCLEVSDTGCGMDEVTKARIFDPFFTTKSAGRGLGLAAVLGIVRGHKGAMRIHSEPGKGTTFKVLFPCSHRSPDEAGKDRDQGTQWVASGTVLVIDDEESVRAVARQMLERAGFTVITAADAREGIEIFREHADNIVAVLLDMTMPDMNGNEALRELHRIRQHVKVILSSGYTEQDVTSRFTEEGLAAFVQKPYLAETLLEELRELLAN